MEVVFCLFHSGRKSAHLKRGGLTEKEEYSRPGLFGSVNTYDNNGHKTSHSDRGLFGGFNHYDN